MQAAKGLRKVQFSGDQDPFAQVTVELPGVDAEQLGDNNWVGTKVFEDGGDKAEWEQTLVVGVDDVSSGVLHVRVRCSQHFHAMYSSSVKLVCTDCHRIVLAGPRRIDV